VQSDGGFCSFIKRADGVPQSVYSSLCELYIFPMPSYLDCVRAFCLSLTNATEDVQWEHNLLFRIAGKMFCIANLEPAVSPTKICFKCTPEKFAELVEIDGIIPAPYMARNHWVAMLDMNALRQPEIKELIQGSYRMILEKLPKKTQASLQARSIVQAAKARPSHAKPPVKAAKAKPLRAVKRRK
jgi:predicted DNA-binding protein (MmcQ/YjbR family)